MARDFRALHAEPERRDLAWRYGIGPEILDPVRRTAEIGNWLREVAKISRFGCPPLSLLIEKHGGGVAGGSPAPSAAAGRR